MSVNYVCKHCHTLIGRIESGHVQEDRLGFDRLTPEDRQHFLLYHSNGDVTVRLTCEYCSEALQRHPELSSFTSPLQ
ncbi:anti-sigma-F factor Fin family protein [Paenibacillus sp. 481]|uniref:anti-sigma-F factor Fin family protein n=1 Tax=Paenibacillus sp. 481 TaxID=2835869 RepID=UPI001E617F01|nr:anti-sigma-F factor Fin family protein [Paenibacillus sp. 481]UHA75333.1 anti-sigma-F factor Fin family protein [Paenibacillus sp. 481]